MRKKSQFNGAYFLAPTTSFLMLGYISIKTHKFRLLRNCTPCLFHSGADKKNENPKNTLTMGQLFLIVYQKEHTDTMTQHKIKACCFERLTVWRIVTAHH